MSFYDICEIIHETNEDKHERESRIEKYKLSSLIQELTNEFPTNHIIIHVLVCRTFR